MNATYCHWNQLFIKFYRHAAYHKELVYDAIQSRQNKMNEEVSVKYLLNDKNILKTYNQVTVYQAHNHVFSSTCNINSFNL